MDPQRALQHLPTSWGTCKRPGKGKSNKKSKKEKYVDIVSAFDIETSSFIHNDYKCAVMYHWQMAIEGMVVLGRTMESFVEFVNKLSEHFKNDVLVIYVHNLAFEFSFIKDHFIWDAVFCTGPRTPAKARMKNIEFRDSLVLSGMSLAKLPTKTKKLKGDLDYSKIRHSGTPLTRKERKYCINDVIVLHEYITQKLKDNKDNLATIPLTRTGYVRRDVRQRMQKAGEIPAELTMSAEQYKKLRKVYAGGFTHAAAHASGGVFREVESRDIASSYPTAMVAEFYPMETFRPVVPKDQAELKNYLQNYACMFKLTADGLRRKERAFEDIISKSKCEYVSQDAEINNGRVTSASRIIIYCNEIDFKDFLFYYDADAWTIDEMEIAKKERLPKSLIEAILEYYGNKTKFKDVKGKETAYALAKEFINAVYGMAVTDPIKPEITYNNGVWIEQPANIDEAIEKHNKSRNRFLYYAWGVWVTSYARHNLLTMIRLVGPDYLYADTDSIKMINYPAHAAQFDWYNQTITAKLEATCIHYGIPVDALRPKTPAGKEKPLGIFAYDGHYTKFKTLGAKRYLYQTPDGEITPTIAGAPKKAAAKWLNSQPDPFETFAAGMVIPADKSGKNIHFYQDEPVECDLTDYQGHTRHISSLSGTYIAPTTVSMKISEEYLIYLAKYGDNFVDFQP